MCAVICETSLDTAAGRVTPTFYQQKVTNKSIYRQNLFRMSIRLNYVFFLDFKPDSLNVLS